MHDAREYDAVVSSGEQVTAGLLAIAEQILGPKGPFPRDIVGSMLVMALTGGVIAPLAVPVQRWCLGIKRKIV